MSNIGMLIQMIKSGNNPQAFAMNMLNQMGSDNPVVQNVMTMMQKGDSAGLEQICKNMCKERGIDPDKMIADVKKQYGL